jgi:hypothetical protein
MAPRFACKKHKDAAVGMKSERSEISSAEAENRVKIAGTIKDERRETGV